MLNQNADVKEFWEIFYCRSYSPYKIPSLICKQFKVHVGTVNLLVHCVAREENGEVYDKIN
jgi:hypothetical protein